MREFMLLYGCVRVCEYILAVCVLCMCVYESNLCVPVYE